jgi:hypothetical protein
MQIVITEVASLTIAHQDPATLRDLLAAGKKVPAKATTLLMQDHSAVKAMYRQYQAESDGGTKSLLARQICTSLTVHAVVEEEVVYPEASRTLEDDEMVMEAADEHGEDESGDRQDRRRHSGRQIHDPRHEEADANRRASRRGRRVRDVPGPSSIRPGPL